MQLDSRALGLKMQFLNLSMHQDHLEDVVFLMCRCLVTCYRHSDWTDPREFSESLFLRNMPADSDVVLRQLSEKHWWRESELELHVRSHEGFPRSPTVEAVDAPCYLLASTCVLHFSSTQVPPFSCLHLSPLYRATPHLDGLWDRLCGSDVNGGTGVLCWQGVRFLLNRLQGNKVDKTLVEQQVISI